jgi:hypothetical protein
MKELRDKFTHRSRVIAADDGEAWRIYVRAVERAKAEITQEEAEAVVVKQPAASAETPKPVESPPLRRDPETPVPSHSLQLKKETPQRSQESQRLEVSQKKRSWLDRLLGRR